ncbi:MAG TPA: hypothetical protein VME70_02085 [Mycobacteriales bacterium]|nr:hypothetical protein [Mycobacteriales bacterium]
MSERRCRACGAAVPEQAQWCSLCFADLREPAQVPDSLNTSSESSPVEAPVPVAVAAQNGSYLNGSGGDVLDSGADALLGLDSPAPAGDAAPPPVAAKPALTWPCAACGENVAMDLDTCPSCGSGFLSGSSDGPSTRLPMVGDITTMSRSKRLVVGLGIAAVVIIVIVLLLTLVGHL